MSYWKLNRQVELLFIFCHSTKWKEHEKCKIPYWKLIGNSVPQDLALASLSQFVCIIFTILAMHDFQPGPWFIWRQIVRYQLPLCTQKGHIENMRFVDAPSDINCNSQHQHTGSKSRPHIFWSPPCFENSRFFTSNSWDPEPEFR